ncbi:hypothetical protein BZG21_43715, partial [Escherichia coli]|nr:hypothetical protein [Escherichia coli]
MMAAGRERKFANLKNQANREVLSVNTKESALERAVRFNRNLEWLEQVEKVIPSGCSTLAKAPE